MTINPMNINSIDQSYMAMAVARPSDRVNRVRGEGQKLYEELKNSLNTTENEGPYKTHIKSLDKDRHIISHIVTNNDPAKQRNHIRVMLYFYKENLDGTITITGKSAAHYHTANSKKGNYVKAKAPDFISMSSGLSGVNWPQQANKEDLVSLTNIINITRLSNYSVAPSSPAGDTVGGKSLTLAPEAVGGGKSSSVAGGAGGGSSAPPVQPAEAETVGDESTVVRKPWVQDKGQVKEDTDKTHAITESVSIPPGWNKAEVLALGGTRFYNPKNMIEQMGDYDNPPGGLCVDIINQHVKYLEETYKDSGLKVVEEESQPETRVCNYTSPTGKYYPNSIAGRAVVFVDLKGNKYQAVLYSMCLQVGGIAVPSVKRLLVSIRLKEGPSLKALGGKTVETRDPNEALFEYVNGKHIETEDTRDPYEKMMDSAKKSLQEEVTKASQEFKASAKPAEKKEGGK